MKYIDRRLKGTFGYLNAQRNFEIIKTIILYAMAIGIFLIGYLTIGTKKNLWTVFAVLAILPASKSLVGVIMFLRFKSLSKAQYDVYCNAVGNLPVLYENVITTNECAYYVPVLCCESNTLIMYCEKTKKTDIKKLTEHIVNVMNNGGHKVSVKVYDSEKDFIRRASEMNENLSDTKLASTDAVFTTIKAVSL